MLIVGRWHVRVGARWLVAVVLGTILLVAVTAAAAAAVESRTVSTYWRGLWWAVSLVTTVGFIGEPPETRAGAALSAGLMIFGFLLLATVSASLAALFVREEELPREEREDSAGQAVLASLHAIEQRLDLLERAIRSRPEDGPDTVASAGWSNGEQTARGDRGLPPDAG
jgi:voltage-gated potassium channel Kch